jgi:hypothetical protein
MRVRRAFSVDIVVDGRSLSTESVDVGLGGVCVRTGADDGLRPGAEISLTLHLPSDESVEATGKVCWRDDDEGEAGIQFDMVAPDHMLRLAQWLRSEL